MVVGRAAKGKLGAGRIQRRSRSVAPRRAAVPPCRSPPSRTVPRVHTPPGMLRAGAAPPGRYNEIE